MNRKIKVLLTSAAKVSRKKTVRKARDARRATVRYTRQGIQQGIRWTAEHYHEIRAYLESPEFEGHLDAYAARIGVKFPPGISAGAKLALLGAACTVQVRVAAKVTGRVLAKAGPWGGAAQAAILVAALYREFAPARKVTKRKRARAATA